MFFSKNIDICSNDKLIFHLNYNNEFYLIDLIRLKWKTSLIYFYDSLSRMVF